jgi:hypothetical protein
MNNENYVIAIKDPVFITRNALELAGAQKIYVKDYSFYFPNSNIIGTVARTIASLPLGHAFDFLDAEGIKQIESYTMNPREARVFTDDSRFKLVSGSFVELMKRCLKHPPAEGTISIEKLVNELTL